MDTENRGLLPGLVLEQMADALIYANASGIIELWNAAAVSLFGYRPGEALGQSLDLIIPAHCTGWRAVNALERAYGERVVVPSAVDKRFSL